MAQCESTFDRADGVRCELEANHRGWHKREHNGSYSWAPDPEDGAERRHREMMEMLATIHAEIRDVYNVIVDIRMGREP
jgi:hypothetical protein